ncbi:MAG: hypothetical protein GY714_14545 [Desulfobacterales bacterium]|nr:hypothetical protein [Desulfobacterales bacterium]MCP4158514.1 hypothetical protein [Deltaproteobacteria bacterium]
MTGKILLIIGGVYHLLFAIFHLFWPKLFQWDKNLSSLDEINRQLMPIMSGLFIYIYIVIFIMSSFFSESIIGNSLGNVFLLSIAGFWFLRAGMQIVYYGLKEKAAVVFFIIFIAGIGLYTIPAII